MTVDLDALEAVLAKTTPGVWKKGNCDFYVDGADGDDLVIGCVGQAGSFRSAEYSVARGKRHPVVENTAAIVALHNAAPALIAEHRALLARVEELERALTKAIERVEKGDLDDQMCCDGHMCGCQGSTVGEQFLYFAKLSLEPKP